MTWTDTTERHRREARGRMSSTFATGAWDGYFTPIGMAETETMAQNASKMQHGV